MAVQSHAKAIKAQKAGHFKKEIVPVHTFVTAKDGSKQPIVIDQVQQKYEAVEKKCRLVRDLYKPLSEIMDHESSFRA